MKDDPLIEEARRAGQAYCESFNHNLDAIFKDLHRRTEKARKAGRTVISHPPRRPTMGPAAAKKAG